MTYTDVFGNNTLPPAEYGYASFNLTTDSTFVWPYNSSNASFTIAKVMDMTCSAGVSLVLPNATEVSTGEDFMVRNVGSETLTVKDASGTQVTQVLPGAATYFYLTSNATADGLYGVIAFGVGTSSVDAASLVGYGVKAIGSSLNQSHPVVQAASSFDLDADYRAKLVVFSGGAATFSLVSAAVLGDDYFTLFRNDGTGTVTLTAYSGDYIDGMAAMQVQPGESLILVCTGTQWFTVGYGRSVLYQFTQLTKDVSAGGTITLTATEASNKLITFVGNPSSAVSVVVPATVAVYYTQSAISTAQTITLKTAGGSGTGVTQGARIIALCDGTNVVSAQSAVANASVSLTNGSVSVPSLFFATRTNTGLYKDGTKSLGVTVEGISVGVFGPNGLQTSTIGPNSAQRHTVPAVASDTVTLNSATQTLTNKTVNLSVNTLSGTKAQFDTALGDDNFAYLGQANAFTAEQTITTNSASTALTITQTGSGNALVVEDTASDTTPFVIDAAGNVLVGSSTPLEYYGRPALGVKSDEGGLLELSDSTGGHAIIYRDRALNNLSIDARSTNASVSLSANGAGVITCHTGGSEKMRINSDGGVSIGTTAESGTGALRVVNTLLTNDRLEINGLGTGNRYAFIDLVGDDTYTDYGVRLIRENAGANASSQLVSRGTGHLVIKTVEAGVIVLETSNVERMRIDSSGNVLLKSATGALGYGTGAGGTVTQATSKSTAVTLNKPTGKITMSNAELAAGASVIFQLTNSLIMTSDTLVISHAWGAVNIDNYRVDVVGCGIGAAKLRVTNIHTASLSEALILNFAVLKGATE